MPSLLHDLWNEGRQAALRLIFPDSCALCQGGTSGSPLPAVCGACLPLLPRVGETRCSVCGEWFVGAVPGPFRCTNCADRRFAFEFATAPYQARAGVRDLIHLLKYDRQLWLAPSLGHLLADALRGPHADPRLAIGSWTLVPVPLHPRRLREREFNQAAELATSLSRLTGHPVADVMQRTRYTTGQASLDRHDRLANLRGAFRLRRRWFSLRSSSPSLGGRDVLLIDDVFTTGATMHECARVLKTESGARRVAALTLARG